MKSYNVKSNAKRFARGLAIKYPGFVPDEPVPVSPEAREWFPALIAPNKLIAEGVPDEIATTALINHKHFNDAAAPEKIQTVGADVQRDRIVMTPAAMAAALADLPPTKSTPEEIEARRQARRERLAAEGPRQPARTKADVILELVSTADGATIRDLMAHTGWQRHTVRGFIAGTLRKRGHNITLRKIKGEEARYVIAAEVA